MKPVILYSGNILPPPTEYEEGDLFLLVSAGELYVRNTGNWLLLGTVAGYVTDGTNVGGGPGEVFDQRVGTVLEFRTLGSPDGTIQISTTAGIVQLQLDPAVAATINSAVQGGVNRGTGLEVFASKVGSNLEFRTINTAGGGVDLLAGQDADHVYLASLTSSDGSITITKNYGTEVDLTLELGMQLGPSGGSVESITINPDNISSITTTHYSDYEETGARQDITVTSPNTASILVISGRITLNGVVTASGIGTGTLLAKIGGGVGQYSASRYTNVNAVGSHIIPLHRFFGLWGPTFSMHARLSPFVGFVPPNTDIQIVGTLATGLLVNPPSPAVNKFVSFEFWRNTSGGTVSISNLSGQVNIQYQFIEVG